MTRAKRTVLALCTGTLVLFVWGALSHLLLIRGIGYAALPEQHALERAAPEAALAAGLYAFPAPPDFRGQPLDAATSANWEARFRRGPSGLLIVRPPGSAPVSPHKLLVQLAADGVAVALAFVLIRSVAGSFWRRAAHVLAFGAGGLVSVGVIYWNWYAFPDAFFAAQCFDMLGGWGLVGCTLAALAPGPSSAAAWSQ